VTASFQTQPAPRTGTVLVVGGIAIVTIITLLMAGLTFVGVAIAFPIAVPIAAAYHLPVSAADAVLAERFAAFWWVFGAFAIASFVGDGVVVVKLISFLSPAPRD
jgi:hypothetical protein